MGRLSLNCCKDKNYRLTIQSSQLDKFCGRGAGDERRAGGQTRALRVQWSLIDLSQTKKRDREREREPEFI